MSCGAWNIRTAFAAKKYAMFQGVINTDKTWGCITQFLAEALEPYDFKEMEMIFGQEHSGRERIHLSDLWEKKKVIFLNISDTDRYADKVSQSVLFPDISGTVCGGGQKKYRKASVAGAVCAG